MCGSNLTFRLRSCSWSLPARFSLGRWCWQRRVELVGIRWRREVRRLLGGRRRGGRSGDHGDWAEKRVGALWLESEQWPTAGCEERRPWVGGKGSSTWGSAETYWWCFRNWESGPEIWRVGQRVLHRAVCRRVTEVSSYHWAPTVV